MQRILSTKPAQLAAQKRSATAARAFASSPQPNPFDRSVKTSLDHAGQKHSFYKLPALADSRIRKWPCPWLTARPRRAPALLDPHSP